MFAFGDEPSGAEDAFVPDRIGVDAVLRAVGSRPIEVPAALAAGVAPVQVQTFDPQAPDLDRPDRSALLGAGAGARFGNGAIAAYADGYEVALPVAPLERVAGVGSGRGSDLMEAALGGIALVLAIGLEQRRREAPGESVAAPSIDWEVRR
jgi:hypothetical protein